LVVLLVMLGFILQTPPQPAMFTASPEQGDGDFTLTSLLRTAESTGYAFHTPQPEQLTVKLFDFQRSTYQVSALCHFSSAT
jgi:hypothetical protein